MSAKTMPTKRPSFALEGRRSKMLDEVGLTIQHDDHGDEKGSGGRETLDGHVSVDE